MIIISLPDILDGKKNGRNIRGRSKSKIDVQKYIVSEGTRELKKREEQRERENQVIKEEKF